MMDLFVRDMNKTEVSRCANIISILVGISFSMGGGCWFKLYFLFKSMMNDV